ncbi:hypothetical protein MPTK1_5g22950 [Marchantia polymorpha subsp. ruderalis]|uniref:Uncharacterized protein n=2 Tax=Marchantia polymorpha TaxID=3197 RepID=A0AAF6BLA9_MARPO|nr:hypothetical protein MARPO_0010s0161 [Marchantia polymorpha]BBN12793.1 hypothetical protein Mp_5g22950 [Marchantia polymorpha subsp. ruderalis]|eukprot:PTQ46785.1 hypothetical protein MARPO_0010s0161 [Marchantia polymorpha]
MLSKVDGRWREHHFLRGPWTFGLLFQPRGLCETSKGLC